MIEHDLQYQMEPFRAWRDFEMSSNEYLLIDSEEDAIQDVIDELGDEAPSYRVGDYCASLPSIDGGVRLLVELRP